MDVKTAFLNSQIIEDVYVEYPHGFSKSGEVCRLLKGLYGLKQSPRMWYKVIHDFLVSLGFQKLQADHSVFMTKNSPFTSANGLIVLVYVDDIKIIGSRAAVDSLKQQLCSKFEMTDLGPISYYLGMTVTRNRKLKTITIQQHSYLKRVLQTFHYWDNEHDKALLNSVKTPMDEKDQHLEPFDGQASKDDIKIYQSQVGSLMYAIIETQPDLAFAIS